MFFKLVTLYPNTGIDTTKRYCRLWNKRISTTNYKSIFFASNLLQLIVIPRLTEGLEVPDQEMPFPPWKQQNQTKCYIMLTKSILFTQLLTHTRTTGWKLTFIKVSTSVLYTKPKWYRQGICHDYVQLKRERSLKCCKRQLLEGAKESMFWTM